MFFKIGSMVLPGIQLCLCDNMYQMVVIVNQFCLIVELKALATLPPQLVMIVGTFAHKLNSLYCSNAKISKDYPQKGQNKNEPRS